MNKKGVTYMRDFKKFTKAAEDVKFTDGRFDPYSKYEPIIVDDDYFLTPKTRNIYMLICRYANYETRESRPSKKRLQQKSGYGNKTVNNEINRLEQLGLLVKTANYSEVSGSQQTNTYKIVDVPEWFYEANGRNRFGKKVNMDWSNVPDGIPLADGTTFNQTEEKKKPVLTDEQLKIIELIADSLKGNDYKLNDQMKKVLRREVNIYNLIIALQEGEIQTKNNKTNLLKTYFMLVKKYGRNATQQEMVLLDRLTLNEGVPATVSLIKKAHKAKRVLNDETVKDLLKEAKEAVNNKNSFMADKKTKENEKQQEEALKNYSNASDDDDAFSR